jgi:predicted lipoprotein with Yx(FWY)xxD motif
MSLSQGFRPILAGVATLLLVAACGQAGATTAPSASAAASLAPSAAASVGPSESAGPAEAYEVDVATDATLGSYLVGEDGRTLYLFSHDTSGKSTCNTSCAANWPPFTLEDGDTIKAGSGVTGTISTIKRDDGTTQVAINGMPLYYFAGDTGKGQINGQGIGGAWYAAGVDGKPVTGASAGGSPAASMDCSGSGYGCP